MNAKVLGQLMLMQSIVINLPDLRSIFSFVKKGLSDIPGIVDVTITTENDEKSNNDSIVRFPISQNNTTFGVIEIRVKDEQLFSPYVNYLQNFIFMLGVILEERNLRLLSLNYQEELEKTVRERTSELNREKENLIESQRRFNDLMSNVTLISVMLDENGNIIFCNNFLLKLTGYSHDELINKNWFDIFIKEDIREQVFQIYKKLMSGDPVPQNYENEILTKSGETLIIDWNNTALYDYNKKIVGTASIGVDITQNRKNENLLKEKNEEYEALNEELKQSNEELWISKVKAEEANQLKTEFLRNMSHEIRTPMNGIIGFSEMINGKDISEEKRSYYSRIIQSSSHQLLKIIDDILEISKLETKKIYLSEETFCLNDFLMQLFSVFDLKAKERNIALYLYKELPDEQSHIISDKTKLNKILSNLIENAIKYTYEGYIEIKYFHKDNFLHISVKDTGIGISKNNQEVIFERFSQEDRELSNKKGGLGLGLSIAKENAELIGGHIYLDSEKGQGATFTLVIPYKKPEEYATSSNAISEFSHEDIFTILIAEDEEVNYLYLVEILNNNYKLIHAKNGKEAVDIFLSSQKIDLILMDIKMPVMDGLKATKMIRESNPTVPIIAQTAYSSESDRDLSLGAGCNDFISKPIKQDDLLNIMSKYTK